MNNKISRYKKEKATLYIIVEFLKDSPYLKQFTAIKDFSTLNEAKSYRKLHLLNKKGKPINKKVKSYQIITPFL